MYREKRGDRKCERRREYNTLYGVATGSSGTGGATGTAAIGVSGTSQEEDEEAEEEKSGRMIFPSRHTN